MLIAIGLFSATHDIACDGYYMTALGRADQARYTGIRVAAFRVAMLVGSSGLVFLGGRVHWLAGFGLGALLMVGLAVAHRVWLPRIHAARPVAQSTGDAAADWRARVAHVRGAYFSFLLQPRALVVLLFLLSFKLGDALMFGMSKVLFRELGISTPDRGVLNGFGTAASIAGAMLGGLWVARVGLRRAAADRPHHVGHPAALPLARRPSPARRRHARPRRPAEPRAHAVAAAVARRHHSRHRAAVRRPRHRGPDDLHHEPLPPRPQGGPLRVRDRHLFARADHLGHLQRLFVRGPRTAGVLLDRRRRVHPLSGADPLPPPK
ncbi:hypothetical protein [Nannocystis pusilla]|uniref:hypothetical protein n=1 Tax=Nannocystis pusilla TaxID=889268 RepID=UPI003B7F9863